MKIMLLKQSNNEWEFKTEDEWVTCTNIELASEELIRLGVTDDEIDLALISIYANNHDGATFENGKFVASI